MADALRTPTDIPRDVLGAWMRHMEPYGQVWYEDIGRDYFNQEHWYLRYWRGEPLNIGDACNCMKTGSARTRHMAARALRLHDGPRKSASRTAAGRSLDGSSGAAAAPHRQDAFRWCRSHGPT